MARVAEELVGRTAELRSLERTLDELGGGGAAAIALMGEPGIGKTRLLAELGERARSRGWLVLSGSASELEAGLPFWVFADALDDHVAGLGRRRPAWLDDELRADLAPLLLPSLAEMGTAPPPDQRQRSHRAARILLERLAGTTPLVLALDDVHWADAASIELLAALLRAPPGAPVLVATASRPRQLPQRLASAFERAVADGSLTLLELGTLGREDAARLLDRTASAELVDALYEQSGGNPFYLEELARSLERTSTPQGTLQGPSLAGLEVPHAVAAALSGELALLSSAARRLFEGAAVAGDPFELELAAAAAESAEAAEALDELLAAELVGPAGAPGRFRFRHPLVRTVVYETAPAGWRLGAHARCAQALAGRGAPVTSQAHHVEYAARRGDTAALAILRDAAGSVMNRAPASAARWLEAALRILPAGAPPEERLGLLMARAGALAGTGMFEASRSDLLEGLELVPEEDISLWVGLTVGCAGMEHLLGRHEEARARLSAALDHLPESAGPEAVSLMLELAVDGLFRAEYDWALEWAARAAEAAKPLGEAPLAAAAVSTEALAGVLTGETGSAATALARAAALVGSLPDEQLAARPDAAANLAAATLFLDRFEEARIRAERALAAGRATGHLHPSLFTTLAMAQLMTARLSEAAAGLDVGIEAARVSGIAQGLAFHLAHRSLVALAAGEPDRALEAAEEAVELTRKLDERFISSWCGLSHAAALLAAGDPRRAADVLAGLAGDDELTFLPGSWRTMSLELLTRCRLSLGMPDEARAAARLAETSAAALQLPMASAWARRAAATVALDAHELPAAADHALASAASADSAAAVLEAAEARLLGGRALAQAGDAERAAEALERAAAAFDACGARRRRDAAERELRRLGRRIHRRTRTGTAGGAGLESLSERELEVARLVVDRKSNREIAAELFVSLKTVEAHMRSLFRKLDVSSRVEVARVIERADLEGPR
jgi:DNA-binding NarL/FixJ family response regulator